MKWPASCQRADRLDGPGIGLGGQDVLVLVGLGDAGADLLGPQPLDPPQLLLVRELDAEAPLGGRLELVPVVVERAVDVNGDAHGR